MEKRSTMKITRIVLILLLGILLLSGFACVTTKWQLSTVVEGQGSISPSEGAFSDGDVITLTAMPTSGWSFDHWGGHCSGNQNPVTITMDSDKTIYAYFMMPTPTPTPTHEPVAYVTPEQICDDWSAN